MVKPQGPWPRLAFILILIAGLLYLLIPIATGTFALNHDCALELACADLIADGKLPYRDIVEINPHLIMYLNLVPIAIARLLGVNPIPVFLLLVTGLVAWSCWAVGSLLRRAREAPPAFDRYLFVAGWGALSLAIRGHSFGQREHLFVLFYLPFFVLRWLRWEGAVVPRVAPLLGLLAGLSACIKPHFLVIAAAPEIYWVIAERRWRPLVAPETLAFVGVGLAFAAHFLVLPTAMTEPLFHRWIPLIRRGYAAYDVSSWTEVATAAAIPLGFAVLCAIIAICLRDRSPLARLTGPLVAMALSAYAVAVLQNKGWIYQQIPLKTAEYLLAVTATACVHAFTVERGVAGLKGQTIRHWVLVPLVIITVVLRGRSLRHAAWDRRAAESLAQLIEGTVSPTGKVLVLSTSVGPHYPALLMAARKPASRYLWSFSLPMLLHGTSAASEEPFPYRDSPRTPEEARYLDELSEDIALNRPELVLIHDAPGAQGCPPTFVLSEYFRRVGFLDRAMSDYTPSGRFESYAVFRPAAERIR